MANQFITAKLKGVKEALDLYDKNLVRKAARSALDKTGTWMKQKIVASVSSMYYVKPVDVRKAIEVKRTSMSSLSVKVIIKGLRLQLFKYFHAFRSGHGISVNVSKINTMHIPGGFIQTSRKTGYRGTMKRKGEKRYPLKGLTGPAIPDLVGGQKIMPDLEAKAEAELEKKFWEEIDKRITVK